MIRLVENWISSFTGVQPPVLPVASISCSRDCDSNVVTVAWDNDPAADEYQILRNETLLAVVGPGSTAFVDGDPLPGVSSYAVVNVTSGGSSGRVCRVDPCATLPTFVRGDADGDGAITVIDAIFTLNALFAGGPQPACAKAADTDDDGILILIDPIFTLNYLFIRGSAEPPAPGPACGIDPSDDGLECVSTCTP